ncbi:MAG: hypothetical protein LBG97_00400 [Coriobacteriales bacterium]|jgi:hypothetical protein|nr:hypothetical protein [Coriobacteriales bacterium]
MSQRLLKIYDINLLKFTPGKDSDGNFVCHINKIYDDERWRLPLDLELSDTGLASWLKRRGIPRNRAYVQNLLSKMGLNIKDTMGVIDICYGLSLNDSFWVTPSIFERSFAECNLYDNAFDEFVAEVAFSGLGDFTKPFPRTSPEFTTGGMLAKAWRRCDNGIFLYKSGTSGFANAGKEPYSEYYSAQIASMLGFKHTFYDLELWKDMLCSTCKLWTDINTAFIPIGHIIKTGSWDAVVDFYSNRGAQFISGLKEMLIFDAIVINEDRHYGNFGVLLNSQTNEIIAPAPIFDNGLSLLWSEMESDIANYSEAIRVRLPKAYDNYIGAAQRFMTDTDKENLRKLRGFRFTRHPEHNLSEERLSCLEQMIQGQVEKLLR